MNRLSLKRHEFSGPEIILLGLSIGFAFGIGTFGIFHRLNNKKRHNNTLLNANENENENSNSSPTHKSKRHTQYIPGAELPKLLNLTGQRSLPIKLNNSNSNNNNNNNNDDDAKSTTTEQQVQELINDNERLTNLLIMSTSAQYNTSNPAMLTTSDIETIRAIFDSVDTNQNGSVDVKEFQELFSRLGEEITHEEATKIALEIDPHNKGEVNFNNFLIWWHTSHKGGKKSQLYRKKFKMANAKLKEFDDTKVFLKPVGMKHTNEYRIFFNYEQKNGTLKQISPWHDIPLHHLHKESNLKIYNFICEVPKWTRAKFEIATGEPFNPIKQDVKNGTLRFYQHGDMMFNYGALPQTWENPEHVPKETECPGDNDPIDCIELGTKQLDTGSITPVKVLGVLALLDTGETDWKVLAININDPLANILHDVHDIEKHIPGAIFAIREYLRIYKVCTGAAENKFAFRGEALNQEFAVKVIEETHIEWEKLHSKSIKEV